MISRMLVKTCVLHFLLYAAVTASSAFGVAHKVSALHDYPTLNAGFFDNKFIAEKKCSNDVPEDAIPVDKLAESSPAPSFKIHLVVRAGFHSAASHYAIRAPPLPSVLAS